jgi:ubiquinone/menaquinone biosynthesis C-methylase UbiE
MPGVSADDWLADTRVSYDTVAASYADQMRQRLDAEPYLRSALTLFAGLVQADGGGPVADVGCGPGHVTLTWPNSAPTRSGLTFRPR